MASLLEDLDCAAVWISRALQSSGYAADFSPASLCSIDRFLDEHTTGGKPRPGGLLAPDFGARLFALGAHTGEVIRQPLWLSRGGIPRRACGIPLRAARTTAGVPVIRQEPDLPRPATARRT